MGKLGINVSIQNWERMLNKICETDFKYLLIKEINKFLDEEIEKLKEKIYKMNLIPFSLHSWFNLFIDNKIFFKISLNQTHQLLKIAKKLSVKDITIHPPVIVDTEITKREEKFISFLKKVNFISKKMNINVKISIENVYDEWVDIQLPYKFVIKTRNYNLKNVGLCLDIGHLNILGFLPDEKIKSFEKKFINTTHIHDNNGKKDFHNPPGKGNINWKNVMNSLKEIDYSGPLIWEVNKVNSISKFLSIWENIQKPRTENNFSFFNIGRRKYFDNEIDEAIGIFKKVPNTSYFWKTQAEIYLAKCYEKKQDYSMAIEKYKEVILKNYEYIPKQGDIRISTLPFIFYKIGDCLIAIGRYQDAIKEYEKSIKTDISNYWKYIALFKKFYIYKFKFGDNKSALKEWENFSKGNNLSIFSSILTNKSTFFNF